jgi:hypothetical protein
VHDRRFATLIRTVVAAVAITIAPAGVSHAQSDTNTDDTTVVTVNEFVPTDRDLSECISALPKPGCGSDARGGWRQTAIFGLVIAGLGFIGWRVVVGARRRPEDAAQSDQR